MEDATVNRFASIKSRDRKTLAVEAAVIVALIVVAVAGRVYPHPANFTPIAAAALCAGFMLRSRLLALAVPISAVIISNFFEEAVDLRIAIAVGAALSFPVLLRGLLREQWNVTRVIGCSLLASAGFFLISNLAVWAYSPMYTHDLAGLATCFTAALPFLRNSLAGDLTYSAAFFGLHALWMLGQDHTNGKLVRAYVSSRRR